MTGPKSSPTVRIGDQKGTMVRYVGIFGSREGVSESTVRALIARIPDGWGIVTGGCLGPKRKKCRGCDGGVWLRDGYACAPCNSTGLEPQKLTAVDWLAIKAAMERGMPVMIFPADWERLGNAAGPIRNQLVAKYAEEGRYFGPLRKPNGKLTGTGDTEEKFRRAGKSCWPGDVA